jgi:hypothetical protein
VSEVNFSSGGGLAHPGPWTWGGDEATRIARVCAQDGHPYPAGSYGATVAAGFYMARDDKHGVWMWVKAGEMAVWDGAPNPVRTSLRAAKAALYEAAQKLGVGI